MWYDFLQYAGLGFAITALPGAVFIETVRRALAKESSVFIFLVGNMAGVLIIIATVFLGLSGLLAQPAIAPYFYAINGLVLLYIGTSVLLKSTGRTRPHPSLRNTRTALVAFATGLILAVANPLSIVFWISLAGTCMHAHSTATAAVDVASVIAGALACFAILIVCVRFGNERLKRHTRYGRPVPVAFWWQCTACLS